MQTNQGIASFNIIKTMSFSSIGVSKKNVIGRKPSLHKYFEVKISI